MEQRVLAEVERLVNNVQRAGQSADTLGGQLDRLNGEKNALLQERQRILHDYREGYFCSNCNRSRTELGGDAAFWAHIQEGASEGRHAVPATAQQIADKEREFEPKLASVDAQVSSVMQSRQAQLREAEDAREQMTGGFPLLEAAADLERMLIRGHESEAETQERTEIRQLDGELAHLRSERNNVTVRTAADEKQVQMFDASIRASEQVELRIENDSRARYDRYVNEARTAEENRARQYAQASGMVARAGGGTSPPMGGGSAGRFGGADPQLQTLMATRDRVNQTAPTTILGPVRVGHFNDAGPSQLPPPTTPALHAQSSNAASQPPASLAPTHNVPAPQAPPSHTQTAALPVPGNTSLGGSTGSSDAAAAPVPRAPVESAEGSCSGVSISPDFARLAESMGDNCTCWGEGSYKVTGWGADKLSLDASATAMIVDSTGQVSLRGGNLYVKYYASRPKAHFYYGLSGVINHALASGQQETTPLAIYETIGKPEDTVVNITARYCKQ